jgi:hypothetical protein
MQTWTSPPVLRRRSASRRTAVHNSWRRAVEHTGPASHITQHSTSHGGTAAVSCGLRLQAVPGCGRELLIPGHRQGAPQRHPAPPTQPALAKTTGIWPTGFLAHRPCPPPRHTRAAPWEPGESTKPTRTRGGPGFSPSSLPGFDWGCIAKRRQGKTVTRTLVRL